MTEREQIEAKLDVLNTVYVVGDDIATSNNVRMEIRKMLANKDIADLVQGNDKTTGIVQQTMMQNYVRLLEKKLKARRNGNVKYFIHGVVATSILAAGIFYFILKHVI